MSKSDSPAFALPSRREMQEVATAWEAFMTGRNEGLEKVRPVIRESWQRAQRLGVDPYLQKIPAILSAEELESLQERADLVHVVVPLFEMIVKVWEKEKFLISLGDRHGRLLHLSGHPRILQQATEMNAIPGSGVGEEQIGTLLPAWCWCRTVLIMCCGASTTVGGFTPGPRWARPSITR